MHSLLKNLSVLLVSAPVLAFAWTFGGSRVQPLIRVMPWASLACAVGLLLLPQRHGDEAWGVSVRRVVVAVLKDSFFWVALVLMAYLAIPLFNVALCPGCDWQAIDAGVNPKAPCQFLPFSVRPAEHAGLLWLFGPSLLAALAIRHGLTRSGKRTCFELLVWNGAALALLGVVQKAFGALSPFWGDAMYAQVHFFSVFGYPNMGGAFFTLMFAFSLGLWCCRMGRSEAVSLKSEKEGGRHVFLGTHYPFLAVMLNLCGVLGTLCRAAIIFVVALSAIFFVYVLLRAFSGHDWRRGRRFRHAIASCSLMMGLFAAVYVYAPPEVGREIGTVSPLAIADRVTGKGEYHTRVATAIMRDFPFFGVGGWGYRHFSHAYMTDEELRHRQRQGGANVHNDYLQFLAEHGIVGALLIVACVWILAAQTGREWRRLVRQALASERSGMGSSTLVLFAISPAVLWSFLGCLALLVHAFGDCPLRSGAVLAVFLAILPVSYGFIPHENRE